jgi:hypothetical protein
MGGIQIGKLAARWGDANKAAEDNVLSIDSFICTPTLTYYVACAMISIQPTSLSWLLCPTAITLTAHIRHCCHFLTYHKRLSRCISSQHSKGQALLLIGTFCDASCTASFTDTMVKITHTGLVLEGTQVPPGLWAINLQEHNDTPQALVADMGNITTSVIKFLHVSAP